MLVACVAAGIVNEDLERLRALLGALAQDRRERCLLPFLTAEPIETTGNMRADGANRIMLSCLSGTAPASVFMRPTIFADIRILLQVPLLSLNGARVTIHVHCRQPSFWNLSGQGMSHCASLMTDAYLHASFCISMPHVHLHCLLHVTVRKTHKVSLHTSAPVDMPCMVQEGVPAFTVPMGKRMDEQCPLLHSWLLPHLQHATLPDSVVSLLRAMLQVKVREEVLHIP